MFGKPHNNTKERIAKPREKNEYINKTKTNKNLKGGESWKILSTPKIVTIKQFIIANLARLTS